MQKLIANTEKERAEHEKALQDMCQNAEERAKTMEVDYAKALKDENVKLRSNLLQSHEHESERLVNIMKKRHVVERNSSKNALMSIKQC